jgi:hypothetical protein
MPKEPPVIKNIDDIIILLLANVKRHNWMPSKKVNGYYLILPATKDLDDCIITIFQKWGEHVYENFLVDGVYIISMQVTKGITDTLLSRLLNEVGLKVDQNKEYDALRKLSNHFQIDYKPEFI